MEERNQNTSEAEDEQQTVMNQENHFYQQISCYKLCKLIKIQIFSRQTKPGCVMSNPNKTVTTFVDFTEPKITF